MQRLRLIPDTIFRFSLPLILLAAGTAGGGIFLSSCEDEIEGVSPAYETIVFTPEVDASWNPLTRSSDSPPEDSPAPRRDTVYTLSSGEDGKLYLSVEHTDSFPALPEGEAARTRGAGDGQDGFSSFRVYAYTFTDSWQEDTPPDLMSDVEVNKEVNKKDGKNVWSPDGIYYMPGKSCKVNFFGYSPAGAPGLEKPDPVKGYPRFTLTVPDDISQQRDVLFGYNQAPIPSQSKEAIPMQFSHALTAVNFAYGTENGKIGFPENIHITRIELSGIKKKGTAEHAEHGFSGWTPEEETATYRIDNLTADHKQPGQPLSSPLLLMPQSLTSASKLTVHLSGKVNGKTVLEHQFNGDGWKPGETVTYRITTQAVERDTVFRVVLGPNTYDLRNDQDFTTFQSLIADLFGPGPLKSDRFVVEAYITDKDNQDPKFFDTLEYTFKYMYNNQAHTEVKWDQPSAFFSLHALDDPKRPKPFYAGLQINIPAVELTNRSSNSQKMANNTPYSEDPSSPRDLSMFDWGGRSYGMSTANCYIVDRAGWYKFPLVYGSSFRNGTEYREAWNSDNYQDGLGKISSSWLQHPDLKAELVWEDAQGLVTDVQLEGNRGNQYIKFHVPRERIMEGNALIAVKQGDVIVWSWHIWLSSKSLDITQNNIRHNNHESNIIALGITDQGEEQVKYVPKDEKNYMMKLPLGSMETNRMKYPMRLLQLTVKSPALKGTTRYINAGHGAEESEEYYRNCLYYQWGRKDPMFPNDGGAKDPTKPRKVFSPYGTLNMGFWTMGQTAEEKMRERCRKPFVMDTEYTETVYVSLWNPKRIYKWGWYDKRDGSWNGSASSQYDKVDDRAKYVKTVYDPSPAGFRVPIVADFQMFFSRPTNFGSDYRIYRQNDVDLPVYDGLSKGTKAVKLYRTGGSMSGEQFLLTPYYGYYNRTKVGNDYILGFGEKAYFWCGSTLNSAEPGAMEFSKNNDIVNFRGPGAPQNACPVYSVVEDWYCSYLENTGKLDWKWHPWN